MEKSENRYGIPILAKGFEILELISQREQGITLMELVAELDFPKTSIYRILCSFEHMGYLRKNPATNRFVLTAKIFGLALSTLGNTSILELSYESMLKLRDDVGESVLLGIPVGNKVVALEQVLGSHEFSFTLRPGTKVPLHTSSPGKVLAAYAEAQERQRMLDSIEYEVFNERTISNRAQMEREIDKVLACGYGVDLGEELTGVVCIAAPIFNHMGKAIASIWITGPEGRLKNRDFEKIAASVMASGQEISKKMGYER